MKDVLEAASKHVFINRDDAEMQTTAAHDVVWAELQGNDADELRASARILAMVALAVADQAEELVG